LSQAGEAIRAVGDPAVLVAAEVTRAAALVELERTEEAIEQLSEAMPIADACGYKEGLAWGAATLAAAALQRDAPDAAATIVGYAEHLLATHGFALPESVEFKRLVRTRADLLLRLGEREYGAHARAGAELAEAGEIRALLAVIGRPAATQFT
jgi:hypothetical protein